MSKLQLILLGRFECLLSSGMRISLSMRKAEVLLAYLALAPGLRHPRERLINLLWSDRGEEQARNSLRQCLSAIKKSLGKAADLALQVDRTTVYLSPELIEVDAHEFERLAAEDDYESLTTAADLYQGEFLEGISIRDPASQEWLDNERSRFKRQFIEILSKLAETQLISHDFGHAIRSAERLVKQDPLGESGWRLLMRSYHESGDRNHALQAFKRCQQSLRDELDIEPDGATCELREQIAGGETRPPGQPVPMIKKATTPAPASTDHSIAVLPFDNLSGDPEQEYFSDGITDSIILNLSLFPGLNVKSRNSSFAFKQQIKSLGEISQELEVDYVVEGSIRKSTDRIRITVQLIEAASGNQVWGKRYDAEIDNLFDLEEELSRSIAATVTGQIESDLQRVAVAKGAAGQESYDLLLSGVYHAVRFNRQDSVIGIEKLNQCLAQDPDNVRAHVHLYSCHSMNHLELQEDFEAALEMAERSYRLDPYHPWVEWELAVSRYFCGQYEATLETIENARTSPSFTRIFSVAANIKLGRSDAAKQTLQAFLRQCRENMLSMPTTLDEWNRYFQDNYLFANPKYNRDIIDCLLAAGLEQELSSADAAGSSGELPSILVLPFSNLSGDPEQEYFSDGITESIILRLSSFGGLNIKSRHASFAYKNSSKSIEEIAADLDVKYVVEGSVRKLGERLRITVGLGDVASGNQLWGKRFDSNIGDLFSLEEELSWEIAGTISSRVGKEARLIALRKPAKDLQSYDYYMRGCYHLELFTGNDINIAIEQLEKCLTLDPDNALAHAKLGIAYMMALYENCTLDRKRSTELMDQHMNRALELDPDDAEAHAFLAERHLYTRGFDRALVHARKAVELNPTLADGYSMLAWHAGATGDIDKALEYAEKSMRTDIHHPYAGWNAGEIYRLNGEYEKAIETFRSMAHISASVQAQIAACLAGLNRIDEAHLEMQRFLELAREQMATMPTNRAEWYDFWWETMPYKNNDDSDRFFDLLLQAGLCDDIAEPGDDMPSIAVLPFENMSGDPEQEYFSDGITNDIVTMLSHIRRLRVVARHSTMVYKDHKPPISEIAEEQGVRYILDGSVRKSGKRIRVNVQLIDSHSGENCWAETYDRKLKDIFAVQDEITRNIAVELQVHLISGESARDQSMGTKSVRAWELVSMAWDLQDSYVKDNMLKARQMVDEALELDPEYSSAWVVLGWTYWQGANVGFNESIDDSINKAMSAAERALALNPDFSEALVLKGCCHVSRGEPELAVEACSKAVEISPGNAEVQALTSYTYNYIGAYDKSLPHHEASLRLCPICPNWFLLVGGTIYQHTGDLEKAIETYRKGVEMEPESPLCRIYLIDALIEADREKEARACADEIRALDNSFTITGMLLSHSHDKDVRDRYQANLEKVGFKI